MGMDAGPDPALPGSKATTPQLLSQEDSRLLERLRRMESSAETYTLSNLLPRWNRAMRAYRNEHFEGSKYRSADYKNRSSIFKPKTRSAVRKNMAALAAALFATKDVMTVGATDEGNPANAASAAIKQELMNYRLSRTSGKNGIPWFQITMAASQSAQINGIVISEQTWKYKRRPGKVAEKFIDGKTGEPGSTPKVGGKVIFDRPDCTLHPPENVLIDPTADWLDPAQSSGYIHIRIPMQIDQIMAMIQSGSNEMVRWRNVTKAQIKNAAGAEKQETRSARQAREGNTQDRMENTNDPSSDYKPVWVYKTYMRMDDEEYVVWSIGTNLLLSDLMPIEEVYPECDGMRPIVIGFGAIEAFNPFPMSPAESWQPLQQETNDITNLRLDQMKHAVNPAALVKRGKNVDLLSLQKRGPGRTILVSDETDVTFEKIPDPSRSAYEEDNYLNVAFDDLTGAFGAAAVATNRDLNETVGGMRMMNSAANSVTQLDLRVLVETWVEPALRQILRLEEFYENDETVIALCGEKAQLFQKFGIDAVTDTLLMMEAKVSVGVGVGMGSPDPMDDLNKFGGAMKIGGEALMPFIQAGAVQMKPKENGRQLANYVFSKAGISDGGDRFFDFGQEGQQQQPQDPRAAAEAKKMEAEAAEKMQKVQAAQDLHQMNMVDRANKAKMDEQALARDQIKTNLARQEADAAVLMKGLDRRERVEQAMLGREERNARRDELAMKQTEGRMSFTERRQAAAEARADRNIEREERGRDREEERHVRRQEFAEKAGQRAVERTQSDQDFKQRQRHADEEAGRKDRSFNADETRKSASFDRDEDRKAKGFDSAEDRAARGFEAEQGRAQKGHDADEDRASKSFKAEEGRRAASHRQDQTFAADNHKAQNKQADAQMRAKKDADADKKQDKEIADLKKALAAATKEIAALRQANERKERR